MREKIRSVEHTVNTLVKASLEPARFLRANRGKSFDSTFHDAKWFLLLNGFGRNKELDMLFKREKAISKDSMNRKKMATLNKGKLYKTGHFRKRFYEGSEFE